ATTASSSAFSASATISAPQLGPWLSGLIFDRTGGYLAIYLWALAIALTGFTLTTRPEAPIRS
ncbi:MAG TPA: MFS transporter, partial [Candidatus Eisenbacteria bacterium]|nr:MFS transporter [Candidatus Eisenbacteria bacterium]